MDRKQHWEQLYARKSSLEVSWYQADPESSLELIRTTGIGQDARILDVGGGASLLVDRLAQMGYRTLAVLDISSCALEHARQRLGARAPQVEWIETDVTQFCPPHLYDVWHDRAVFHFLTAAEDRARYVAQVRHAVKPGGHVIVGSFGPGGPLQCSGLDVVCYSPDTLHGEFGAPFELVKSTREAHLTPGGKTQEFVYCYCRKRG